MFFFPFILDGISCCQPGDGVSFRDAAVKGEVIDIGTCLLIVSLLWKEVPCMKDPVLLLQIESRPELGRSEAIDASEDGRVPLVP